MALAMAGGGFGMGLDDDAGAGIFGLRMHQHLAEGGGRGAPVRDRGVAPCLVDHQHVGAFGHLRLGVEGVVFRQMRVADALCQGAGAVQQGGVVQRVGGKQMFQIRRPGAVEMHPAAVQAQPDGRRARPPRQDRAQEGVLDTQHRRPGAPCHRLAARRGGACPPDADPVFRSRPAEADFPAGQLQDAPDAPPGEKTSVVDEQPPGIFGPGGIVAFAAHAGVRGRRPWPAY